MGLASARVRLAILIAALLGTTLALRGTYGAVFYSAITSHVGGTTAATAAIYDPSNLTATGRGDTMRVSFTDPGVGHHGDGYALYGYHFGPAAGTCSTNPTFYTFIEGVALTSPFGDDTASAFGGGNSATDATFNVYDGSYTCYMLRTWVVPGTAPAGWTSATTPQWTSLAPTPAATPPSSAWYVTPTAVQVGFLALQLTAGDGIGSVAGVIDAGDTIKVQYSQTVDSAITTSLPTAVSGLYLCHHKAGPAHTFYLGELPTTVSTSAPVCNTTADAANANIVDTAIGVLTGAISSCSKDQLWPITAASLSTTSITNDTLTVTLGNPYAAGVCLGATVSGSFTLTPSAVAPSGTVLVRSSSAAYPAPVVSVPPCNANHSASEGQPVPSSQTNVCIGAGLTGTATF